MTNIYDPRTKLRTTEGWFDVGSSTLTPVLVPTATNVGVDALDGWIPTSTIGAPDAGELVQFSEEGGVLQDTRIYGGLMITAAHVTVRRCEIIGGCIDNTYGNQVGNDLLVEDSTVRLDPPGVNTEFTGQFAIGTTGMLVRRCAVVDTTEGFRLGGSDQPLRDPDFTTHAYDTRIYNTYIRITGPHPCSPVQGVDYHGDGLQAFDAGLAGVGLTMRNCRIESNDQWTTGQTPGVGDPGCGGTSNIICGAIQAKPFDIDGLVMSGAAYCFICENGGIYKNLYIVEDAWVYGPVSVPDAGWDITDAEAWSCYTCTLDGSGQIDTVTASIPHGYPGFGPLDPPP